MIYLNVHSHYSLLAGTISLPRLIGRAVETGARALALTDSNGLYGVIPFYQAARAAGLHAIIGVELDGVVLLARDRTGYTALCEAVTAFQLTGRYDLGSLAASRDVVVLSGDEFLLRRLCKQGGAPVAAVTCWGDPGSRYRAGRLVALAKQLGIRAAAAPPVWFLERAEASVHDTLTAIRLNTTTGALRAGERAPREAWFRPPEAMACLYEDWPEVQRTAEAIAEECQLELAFGTPLFPACATPPGESAYSHLWRLAVEGLRARYGAVSPAHTRRLQHELEVIHDLGFAPYFVIVWDIVRYAQAEGIPIMGRGSAANSLVAYCLGITRADPFRYDLYFERFLNRSRTDCPDIDLDICWRRRDQVLDYVYAKYGAEQVAMICTFNTFKARSAVREVAKARGMTGDEIGGIARLLPQYEAADIEAVVRFIPECRGLRIDCEPLKSVVETARFLDGFPRHLSIHSGGVVIAPGRLTGFVPLQRATKGLVITQYDMHPIEALGLIKMDLLGHRSLTVIDDTVGMVRANRGLGVDVERLPDPDPLTAKLLRHGRTIGCFQIESPAMRALLRHTLAETTDMLIKALSLVRPGPSGSGMKQRFIARRLGREATEHLHPALRAVLGDTYGVMLYQEDILKVAAVIAGMDLAQADGLRRAMTKQRSPREMAKWMESFVVKACANGVDRATAETIWGHIANFAAYSYCKAHACTYGEVAYQCAYLKAHFPAEFLAAVLTNQGGYYDAGVYEQEALRMSVTVHGPDVNVSAVTFTAEGDAVRVGLMAIRCLRRHAIGALLAAREAGGPFRGMADLCRRTGISSTDAEALVHAGACDGFGLTRPGLLWEMKRVMGQGAGRTAPVRGGELFAAGDEGPAAPLLPDYSRRQRADEARTRLEVSGGTHPLAYYQAEMSEHCLVLAEDLPRYAERTVTMVGWLVAERRVGLKDRGAMKFLTFEDPSAVFEGVLFPEAYQRHGHLLTSRGPFLVLGLVQEEDHYCTLIIDSLHRLGGTPLPGPEPDPLPGWRVESG